MNKDQNKIHLELFNYKEANTLWNEEQKKILFSLLVDLNLISSKGEKRTREIYGLHKQIKGMHDAIRECDNVKIKRIAAAYQKNVDKALLKLFGVGWTGSIKRTKSCSKELSDAYLSAKQSALYFLNEYNK